MAIKTPFAATAAKGGFLILKVRKFVDLLFFGFPLKGVLRKD